MILHTVVWSSVEYPGMEYLTLKADEHGIEAASVVVGVESVGPFRLDYRLYCGPRYEIRTVSAAIDGGAELRLTSDGHGHWFGRDGVPLPELNDCFDVDISATPFTNTLPIRRLDWQAGQSQEFRMVFITVPTLVVTVERQRYTCLEKTESGATFRFEALGGDFTALLPVDSFGLVLDYPGLFRRETRA